MKNTLRMASPGNQDGHTIAVCKGKPAVFTEGFNARPDISGQDGGSGRKNQGTKASPTLSLAYPPSSLYLLSMAKDEPALMGSSAPGADPRQNLRAAILARRRHLSEPDRRALSLAAQGHILDEPIWGKARTVALYTALPEEVDTGLLLDAAWSEGKHVLLPLCSKEIKGEMNLMPCSGYHQLQKGAYGILEPSCPDLEPTASPIIPDLVIVPGVAFDLQGGRIGMGGGYYDRLLVSQTYAGIPRIGLAFAFQIVDKLPVAAWDQPVQAISTEHELLWIEPH